MLRDPLKGKWFPGVHAAIIDPGLWGEVHAVLAKDSHGRSVETKVRSRTDSLLRGLLFAPTGEPMYPTCCGRMKIDQFMKVVPNEN